MVMRCMLLSLFSLFCTMVESSSLRLITHENAYVVGEMIVITIRGEYAHTILNEKLEFPNSNTYDWIQLERDRWDKERIDGDLYSVFERRIAVFPRSAGRLTIGPVTHRLTVGINGTGRQKVTMTAREINRTITPYPVNGRPLAVSDLLVEESLSAEPGKLKEGETLIRQVTLTATGSLAHLLPQRPPINEPWLISFSAPENRQTTPTPDGPVSRVTWEWHLRPITGEPGVLPEIAIPWFDTVAREMKSAKLNAIPFGYASFYASIEDGASQIAWYDSVQALLAFCVGLLAGLAWLLPSHGWQTTDRIRKMILRLMPDPTLGAVYEAARQGDLVALRAAGERYIQRRRELDQSVAADALKPLDDVLFAPNQKRERFDIAVFLRHMTGRTTTY